MNILFHSWEFGPGAGGIGQYLYQMVRGLSSLGHRCVVVTGKEQQKLILDDYENCKMYRAYSRNEVGTPKVAEDVLRIAKQHSVDLIEGADHWGECKHIIKTSRRPKVLIKLHSCQYLKKLEEVSAFYSWQKLLIKAARWRMRSQIRAERYCVENADAIISPSKKILVEYGKQGAQLPAHSALIPNILHEIPEIGLGSSASRPTFLFAGRLEILKGIEYLPSIVGKVAKDVPSAILEVAGSDQYARGIGSLKEWLKKRLGPLNNSVRFLGRLNPKQMEEAYRRSSLLVFPSKWDNFPMSVLEAMAHCKPVVTTPNGGMPEMLSGTGSAIHVPDSEEFSQAIIRFLTNETLRVSVGEACRQRVIDHYTPQQIIPKYLKFIETCI